MILWLLVLCGCISPSQRTPVIPPILVGSEADVRARFLIKIPIGTSIVDAQKMIVRLGLRCSTATDPDTQQPFLACGYTDDSDLSVTWYWQIRIDCPDGKVSNITCERTGTGP